MTLNSPTTNITPFLWFHSGAENAVDFYLSIFKDSKRTGTMPTPKSSAEHTTLPAGSTMLVHFELNGQRFTAINGGPHMSLNGSVSFVISCDSQEEIDYYWEKLSEGADPEKQMCGWLTDRFGVTWQIVPKRIEEFFSNPDSSERVMEAIHTMKKLDLQTLEDACASATH